MAASDATTRPRIGRLEYAGAGQPDVVIATDLPLDGPLGWLAAQLVEAVRLVLETRGWRAGAQRVGYRSCDDADGGGGVASDMLAEANARALVADPAVVALLGPFNSGLAMCALPITARAGLVMVSPANTYVALTSSGPAFYRDEPARYLPGGRRAYLRVFPNDNHQAAAIAQLLAASGSTTPYVLHDGEPYGRAIAEALMRAAPVAGLALAGLEVWGDEREAAEAAVRRVSVSGADALVLAGVPGAATRELVAAKVELLGPHDGTVPVVGADAFVSLAGLPAAEGLRVVTPGVRPGAYPPAGEELVNELAERLGIERSDVEPYAVHAAEAADLVLQAIADSDGSRSGVLQALFHAERTAGPLGSYHFAENGDAVPGRGSAVCGFTVFRIAAGGLAFDETVLPRPELVAAASS